MSLHLAQPRIVAGQQPPHDRKDGTGPPNRLRQFRRWAGTTPGVLTAMAASLVIVALAMGATGSFTVRDRAELVRDVGAFSGPLSVRAQDIYRALSDADASAANAFLTNGVEPPSLRQRYLDDIAGASNALADALRDADGRSAALLTVLTTQLPIYTGLIETARTYNRQGLPLGGAYLRMASGLMRERLLPAAQQLYGLESRRLAAAQRAATTPPWPVWALGLVTLACLGAAQGFLTRRTNRMINLGMALATLATLVAVGWTGAALAISANHVDAGRDGGSAQVRLFAEARAAALQARADEALTLIARGNGGAFEQDFTAMMRRLVGTNGSGGLLGQARSDSVDPAERALVEQAIRHVRQWAQAHQRLRRLDDSGRYLEAVKLATSTGRDGPSTGYTALEAALTNGLETANDRFDRRAAQARQALRGAAPGLIVLTGLLLAAAVAGIQRRIGEYR